MGVFYTVDRLNTLRAGGSYDLTHHMVTRYDPQRLPDLQTYVDQLLPGGVSEHGIRYFLQPPEDLIKEGRMLAVELLFEYVRRLHYGERPSRFQSFFAWESPDLACEFWHQKNRTGTIWKVEAQESFRANMNLLCIGRTTLVDWYSAHCYWKGETGPMTARWEYLLIPPVRAIEAITPPGDLPEWPDPIYVQA